MVTGASGFVGQVLCRRLQEIGVRVRALTRDVSEGIWDERVTGDLRGILPCGAMRCVDTVFHLAGKSHAISENRQDAAEYFAINTDGTERLLNAAATEGVDRFIFFSSVKAMGEGGDACLDESFEGVPTTPYGRSKLAAEQLVFSDRLIPHSTVLRLAMVYGSTSKGNLPRMIEAVARGHFPPLAESGNRRSMVHVEDVVQAALLAAENPHAADQTYIVTDDHPYSTRQIYEWICEALNRPISNVNVPTSVLKLLAKAGDVMGRLQGRRFLFDSAALDKLIGSAWYSSAKLQRDLEFKPQYGLRESLPKIIAALGLK